MRPRCFCDRRWRIRAAEGPAGGVKWFSSWRPARVSGSMEVCRRDSTRPRPRHVGASGGGKCGTGWAVLDITKAPTLHGSVTCARVAERPVISSARPAPVASASRLFRFIFQPNLNVAAAHWQQLERLPRRERQPRCVFARVEGPGRRHAWTIQRVGHIGAGHVSYLALCCDATHSSARNTWGGRGRGWCALRPTSRGARPRALTPSRPRMPRAQARAAQTAARPLVPSLVPSRRSQPHRSTRPPRCARETT